MKKSYFILSLAIVLILSVAIIAYGTWLNQQGEFQIAKRMEERTLQLRGAKAEFRTLQPKIVLETINLTSDEMADAVALIDGRIEEIYVDKNSYVNSGDLICSVVNENISSQIKEAESGIMKARATLRQAENDYQRYVRLREKDATSLQQYDAALAQYEAALASLDEMETRKAQLPIQSSRQQVTAPVDGKVLVLYRQQGAYVSAGTALALVGNFRYLYFSTPVEDQTVTRMNINQQAELIFDDSDFQKVFNTNYEAGNLGSAQTFTARIMEITPPLSQPAAIRSVRWQIDNSSGLLEPQTYGGVTFRLSEGHKCLAVPLPAIIDRENTEVFVVKNDSTIERRKVQIGIEDDDFIEILGGLKEGEVVVTSGMKGLEDNAKVSITLEEFQ
ncbi:MAG: efflux RND transporter periplasmic adaptor subunit [Selenomonadaceae bacterium]|nr:efflux RND transporter periplasmic adaptor subunit [Selenomonadaceae bacterium]